jgi:hypothetical protein
MDSSALYLILRTYAVYDDVAYGQIVPECYDFPNTVWLYLRVSSLCLLARSTVTYEHELGRRKATLFRPLPKIWDNSKRIYFMRDAAAVIASIYFRLCSIIYYANVNLN